MGDENSIRLRCQSEHFRIGYANNTALMSADDVDSGFSPTKANYNFMVKIGVRLESRLQAVGV